MRNFPRSRFSLPANMSRRFVFLLLIVLPTLAGDAVGQLTANPTAINFGTVIVGSSSSKSLTLKNTGSMRIKVSRIAVIGTGFKLQGLTTPLVLAAGQSATFSVIFDPLGGVTINGSLAIISDALDPLVHVALSGMGWVAIQSNISSKYFGLVLHPKVLTNDQWPTISFV